jgi:hypothetical protein
VRRESAIFFIVFYPFIFCFQKDKAKALLSERFRSAFAILPCRKPRLAEKAGAFFDRLRSSLPKSPLPSQTDKHSDLTAKAELR